MPGRAQLLPLQMDRAIRFGLPSTRFPVQMRAATIFHLARIHFAARFQAE